MFSKGNTTDLEDANFNLKDKYKYLLKYIGQYPNYVEPSIEELRKIFNIKNNNQGEEDSLTVFNNNQSFEINNTPSHKDSETQSQSTSSASASESASANPILFNIINQKKRGRESLKQRKVEHLSSQFDNLQTKIQVHFLTFIIQFSNDLLKKEFGNKTSYNFKQIDYKIKKVVNHENVQKLKKMKIKELLKMDISPKNKKYPTFANNLTLDKVYKISNLVIKFLDMDYLEVFNNFYFSEDKLIDTIDFEGKQILLSKKTKTFYHLLKKYEGLKSLLINTAKIVYFNGYDKLFDKNYFKTLKNKESIIGLKE